MYVYSLDPIDHWAGWRRESAFPFSDVENIDGYTRAEYERALATAKRAAVNLGWEGDIREGPFISGVPQPQGDYGPHIMIAWKQDNNGQTFVASPVRLQYLENEYPLGHKWCNWRNFEIKPLERVR